AADDRSRPQRAGGLGRRILPPGRRARAVSAGPHDGPGLPGRVPPAGRAARAPGRLPAGAGAEPGAGRRRGRIPGSVGEARGAGGRVEARAARCARALIRRYAPPSPAAQEKGWVPTLAAGNDEESPSPVHGRRCPESLPPRKRGADEGARAQRSVPLTLGLEEQEQLAALAPSSGASRHLLPLRRRRADPEPCGESWEGSPSPVHGRRLGVSLSPAFQEKGWTRRRGETRQAPSCPGHGGQAATGTGARKPAARPGRPESACIARVRDTVGLAPCGESRCAPTSCRSATPAPAP